MQQDPPAATVEASSSPPTEEEPPAKKPWPRSVGPFWIRIGDGEYLQLGMATQLRATSTFLDPDVPVRATFRVPRLRLDQRASFVGGLFLFRSQLNLAPGNLELVDLWLQVTPRPDVNIRMGAMKIPFTRYRDLSFTRLAMADWAAVTRMFGAERQLGVTVHDGWSSGVSWSVGIFTGQNLRISHGVGLADAYGLEPTHPFSLTAPAPLTRVSPEVVARLGYLSPEARPWTALDRRGGPPRWGAWVSAAVDARPVQGQDLALRLAPEAMLEVATVKLTAVGYLGWIVDRDGRWVLGTTGALGEVSWSAHRFFEVAASWSLTAPLPALVGDVQASGAATPTTLQEAGLGFSVPVLGDAVSWDTDVRWLRRDGDDTLVLRSQAQVAF